MVVWKNTYNTGIISIDCERKCFFLFKSLLEENQGKRTLQQEIVNSFLDRIDSHVKTVLDKEIIIYKNLELPLNILQQQIKEHNQFIDELYSIREKFDKSISLINFSNILQNFIFNHIAGTDLSIKNFLQNELFYFNSLEPKKHLLTEIPHMNKPLIVWSEKFEIGVMPIDHQHKIFSDMLNELVIASEIYEKKDIKYKILEFIHYANSHLEAVVEFADKDYLESYTQEIEHYKKIINETSKKLKTQAKEDLQDVIKMLVEWFVDHVIIMDKTFIESKIKHI